MLSTNFQKFDTDFASNITVHNPTFPLPLNILDTWDLALPYCFTIEAFSRIAMTNNACNGIGGHGGSFDLKENAKVIFITLSQGCYVCEDKPRLTE